MAMISEAKISGIATIFRLLRKMVWRHTKVYLTQQLDAVRGIESPRLLGLFQNGDAPSHGLENHAPNENDLPLGAHAEILETKHDKSLCWKPEDVARKFTHNANNAGATSFKFATLQLGFPQQAGQLLFPIILKMSYFLLVLGTNTCTAKMEPQNVNLTDLLLRTVMGLNFCENLLSFPSALGLGSTWRYHFVPHEGFR